MWFLPYAIIAGVVFTAGQFFAKKAYDETANQYVEEPWEDKDIGEKFQSLLNMPMKETVLFVAVLISISSLAKSFVTYRGK